MQIGSNEPYALFLEKVPEIGCPEIGIYYIKVYDGCGFALLCGFYRQIYGKIRLTAAVVTCNYLDIFHNYPLDSIVKNPTTYIISR